MKATYTTECPEVPEGATHYKNVGKGTFFYKATRGAIKGWGRPVFKFVAGEWKVAPESLKLYSLQEVMRASETKKIFEFTGQPEKVDSRNITGEYHGKPRVIIPAYKDSDGCILWIAPGQRVIRSQRAAEKIGRMIQDVTKVNYLRIAGIAPKLNKLGQVCKTVTRTTGEHYSPIY